MKNTGTRLILFASIAAVVAGCSTTSAPDTLSDVGRSEEASSETVEPSSTTEEETMGNLGSRLIVSATAAAVVAGCSSTSAPVTRSELEEYPGFRFVDWQLDEEAYRNEELAREILVSQCMEKEGWQYTPNPAEYIGPDDPLPVSPSVNENEAKALEMSQEDREAYYLALYGVKDPNDPRAPVGGGCYGQVFKEIPGVYALMGKLLAEHEKMRTSIDKHADIAQAETDWVACVKEAGYNYTKPDQFFDAYRSGSGPATEAWDNGVDRCHKELTTVRDRVRIDIENIFAAEHRSELEAHKREFEAGQSRALQIIAAWQKAQE